MLGRFIRWFIVFCLSYLASLFGIANQERAFFVIYISLPVVLLIFCIIVLAICDLLLKNSEFSRSGEYSRYSQLISLSATLKTIATIGIVLFACWFVHNQWNIDFYRAFQIMTFGSCFYIPGTGSVKIIRKKPNDSDNSNKDETE